MLTHPDDNTPDLDTGAIIVVHNDRIRSRRLPID